MIAIHRDRGGGASWRRTALALMCSERDARPHSNSAKPAFVASSVRGPQPPHPLAVALDAMGLPSKPLPIPETLAQLFYLHGNQSIFMGGIRGGSDAELDTESASQRKTCGDLG